MCAKSKTTKRLTMSIVTICLLICCLMITTFALVQVSVEVQENRFHTGDVLINLNDGKAVIDTKDPDEEFRFFEPGMTVVKEFFVENHSTDSVYYRIFMENISGYLGHVLEITIKEGDTVLCSGTADSLTQDKVPTAGILDLNERKDLTITFHYPKDADNASQNMNLSFNLSAEAVQTRNNDPQNPFQ